MKRSFALQQSRPELPAVTHAEWVRTPVDVFLAARLARPGLAPRQEVSREVNTVGAKCQDAPVAHLVVALKAEVERLREQVQNVE